MHVIALVGYAKDMFGVIYSPYAGNGDIDG